MLNAQFAMRNDGRWEMGDGSQADNVIASEKTVIASEAKQSSSMHNSQFTMHNDGNNLDNEPIGSHLPSHISHPTSTENCQPSTDNCAPSTANLNNPFNIPKDANFYSSVKNSIDELLTIHPTEKELCALVPDSNWVKVHYEKTEYYVVGVLKQDNKTTHIAYGVPGLRRIKPPKEADGLCEFVAISNLPNGHEGYWLMFQSAATGEILRTLDF
jgi:hypothetical protein